IAKTSWLRRSKPEATPTPADRAFRCGRLSRPGTRDVRAAARRSTTPPTACRGAARRRLGGLVSRSLVVLLVFLDRAVDERRQPHPGLDRVVVGEPELRHRVEVQAARQLAAQEAGRARQRRDRLLRVLFPREMREEHGRVREVGRDVDVRDRHTADARILELAGQHLRELALDLVTDALGALRVLLHSVRDTSTISYTSS